MRVNRHNKEKSTISSLTKTGQSALEYMMTYGWAILIIVIVAVILYSMGIFSPSSSVSFSSSGFSPFTVSSSSCNSIGYKIAVIAGPIPNNANSLQITKVYVISAAGANVSSSVYTLPSPVTLKSGSSAVIIVPNVACNAANIKYSFSAIIQYTYTVPSIGNQIINTSGTVAGTSIAGKPSILTSYEPLTITHTQTSATPSPFQQMINMTSTDPGWSSIATSNFAQNVEFFYYNGSVIPSWLENYTSSKAIWWLKLPSISNSMVIYMGFAPSTTSLFNNVNTGEAPQLSSTYGQYDDGANIFTIYDSFQGTTLSSQWVNNGEPQATVNNGLNLSGGGNGFMANGAEPSLTLKTNFFDRNYIIESDLKFFSDNDLYDSFGIGILNTTSNAAFNVSNSEIVSLSLSSSLGQDLGHHFQNPQNTITDINAPLSWGVNQFLIMGMTVTRALSFGSVNYQPITLTASDYNPTFQYPMLYSWRYSIIRVNWFRIRVYPPNGVMPSVSFGSV